MKLSKNLRWPIRIEAVLVAAIVLILGGMLGCASKGTKTRPAGSGMTAEAQRDQAFLIPLKHQQRWTYREARPAPSRKPSYLLRSFNFAENGSDLDDEATGVLRDFSKVMLEKPRVRVLVLGLADAYGEKPNADNLGLIRARAAREFLVSQGIDKERTELATIGADGAVAKPDEKIAMSLDRRVEIWLLEE